MPLFAPRPGLKAFLARALMRLDDIDGVHVGCKQDHSLDWRKDEDSIAPITGVMGSVAAAHAGPCDGVNVGRSDSDTRTLSSNSTMLPMTPSE